MVDINAVYSTVLNLANKESNSFVTPEEFNDIAHKAQSEIFEAYFTDLRNETLALETIADDDYSDTHRIIKEKISLFEANAELTITTAGANFVIDQSNFYRFNRLFLPNYTRRVEEIEVGQLPAILNSPQSCPTALKPIYHKVGGTSDNPFALSVYPKAVFTTGDTPTLSSGIGTVLLQYLRTPARPNWLGSTGTGQLVPDINNDNYQNFELHGSEFHNLVNKIASSVGIITRDADLVNFFGGQEQLTDNKEQ